MNLQSKRFLFGKEEKIESVDDGVERQILGYNSDVMMVKAIFQTGSVGYIHSHFHSQVTYVVSGEFEVNIAGELKILEAGDAFNVPPNLNHGTVCNKGGVLIDVFSPHREDFLGEVKGV